MHQGTIKRLTDKGFGFIESSAFENDIFFHASALTEGMFNDLREGDMMSFDVEEGPKGLNAVNVTPATGAAPASDDAAADVADEAADEEAGDMEA